MADMLLPRPANFSDIDEVFFNQKIRSGNGENGNSFHMEIVFEDRATFSQAANILVQIFNRLRIPDEIDEEVLKIFEKDVSLVKVYFNLLQNAYPGKLPDSYQELPVLLDSDNRARASLLDLIPGIATLVHEESERIPCWKNLSVELFLPFLFKELWKGRIRGVPDVLIEMIEQGLLSPLEIEIHLCPEILALTQSLQLLETVVCGILVMAKIIKSLGKDVTTRIFLDRFLELCQCSNYYVRQTCAMVFSNFCVVLGPDILEKKLLPQFEKFCNDQIWIVRKVCPKSLVFVSYSTPMCLRRTVLTPIYLKLLKDKWHYVQSMAYYYLGDFIATFASPPFNCISFDENGDLIISKIDDDSTICMRNITLKGCSLNHLNDLPLDYNYKAVYSHLNLQNNFKYDVMICDRMIDDEKSTSEERESHERFFVSLECITLQFGELNKSDTALMEEFYSNVLNGNVICGVANEDLDNEENITVDSLTSSLLELKWACVKRNLNNLRCYGELVLYLVKSSIGTYVEDNWDIEVFIERDTRGNQSNANENYNSYNYWHISPELPLDPAIICDGHSTNKNVNVTNNWQESRENDNENCNISFFDEDDSEENANDFIQTVDPDEEAVTLESIDEIVPIKLLKHFTKMTNPYMLERVGFDLLRYTAISLPDVTLTIGPNNWSVLNQMLIELTNNPPPEIKRIFVGNMHKVANTLGMKKTTKYLQPRLSNLVANSVDDYHIPLMDMIKFLKYVTPIKRNKFLPKLMDCYWSEKKTREKKWREELELNKQLTYLIPLFKIIDVARYISPLVQHMLSNPVYVIRQQAIISTCEVLHYISSDLSLVSLSLIQFAEKFAHSKHWRRRQTFAQLCSKILQTTAVSLENFATELMPHLLDLSWDPIANVRLVVAKTLKMQILNIDYFINLSNPPYENLDGVLQRLQADKDRDVRFNAEQNYLSQTTNDTTE